jgi:uncharacterized protein YqgV (UPF0045/DUF77 family)
VIAEVQVAPSPAGTPDDPREDPVLLAPRRLGASLRTGPEAGALGTTLEGDDDAVRATLHAAHEAVLAAGAASGISHVEVASVARTMESRTHEFR